MNQIEKLTEYFKQFPGIGERQAKRFVYFLLHKNQGYAKELSESILSLKNGISQCPSCFFFFENNINPKTLCPVCADPKTDKSTLMVVEKDADYESLKRSGVYDGAYFILGGLVPIVTKETPKFVRVEELKKIVEDRSVKDGLKEVIISLSVNPQGEHTDIYLREILSPLVDKYKFKIVSMGRGLSTGTELEYSDSETLRNALKNRS